MDFKVKELDVVLSVKDKTKMYNINDVAKTLHLTQAQKETCLFVFQDEHEKCMFFLFNLGKVETREDCEEVLRIFTETNEANGAKLVNYNQVKATDGRILDVQKYSAKNYTTLAIFSQINNNLFYGLAQCTEDNCTDALAFSVEIMQSLSSTK